MQVDLNWDGGENAFALNLKELEALQQACDAGPEYVLERLSGNHDGWRVADVVDTLRLGLMGAGMEAQEARVLVRKTVERYGIKAQQLTAQAILIRAIIGPPDDPPIDPGTVGEAEAGGDTNGPTFPAESGASPKSTD